MQQNVAALTNAIHAKKYTRKRTHTHTHTHPNSAVRPALALCALAFSYAMRLHLQRCMLHQLTVIDATRRKRFCDCRNFCCSHCCWQELCAAHTHIHTLQHALLIQLGATKRAADPVRPSYHTHTRTNCGNALKDAPATCALRIFEWYEAYFCACCNIGCTKLWRSINPFYYDAIQ